MPKGENPGLDILVVEDDESHRVLLSKLLEHAGFAVVSAADGFAAFEVLAIRPTFHAIVCDIRLPNLSGKGFFEQIEEAYPNMASRVVFLTGFADEERVHHFLTASGQPFLKKPYDPDKLIAVVTKIARKPAGWRS